MDYIVHQRSRLGVALWIVVIFFAVGWFRPLHHDIHGGWCEGLFGGHLIWLWLIYQIPVWLAFGTIRGYQMGWFSKLSTDMEKSNSVGSAASARRPSFELPSGPEAYPSDAVVELGTGPVEPAIPQVLLHEITMQRWKSMPDTPAFWMDGEEHPRSAGQMWAASASVAARLLEGAVGEIVPVMAVMDDGPEYIAGIMGVMIAGAAFCPIDVEHPPERVRYILDNTSAVVLVASRNAVALATGTFGWQNRLIDVDCSSRLATPPLGNRANVQTPADDRGINKPIYVIFTSGSTGKPKGTMLSHRALLSHIPYYMGKFQLTDSPGLQHRILRTTAVTFDMCYSQILGALYSGATLVWPKKQLMKAPSEMHRVIETHGVTFLMMVPSALNLFLELSAFPSCVKHVGSGGEALHHEVARAFFVDRFVDSSAKTALHNRYGPTEAAINVCLKVMEQRPPQHGSKTVPIGRPAAHRNVYVCATSEEGTPEGGLLTLTDHAVPGELYISGPCLADEYLNNPEMTRKAFINCGGIIDGDGRHLTREGLRVYKTGDLMRWVGEELEFIGRTDSQVKLRGLRIELGEIEAQLRAVPGMQEAQVLVREDFPDNVQRLVAFISPVEMSVMPELQTVCAHLYKDLPEYMVPERFVGIPRESWPRTTTGKIDRKELAKLPIPADCAVPTGAPSSPEAAAEPGKTGGAPQAVDSLGFARQMHAKERDVDVALDNLRASLIMMVVLNHWLNGNAWYWVLQSWQEAGMNPIFSEHTLALAFISGLDDARNVNPFQFTAREPVFLLLWCAGLHNWYHWYFPAFVWVKVYTVTAHKYRIRPWIYVFIWISAYVLLPAMFLQVKIDGLYIGSGCVAIQDWSPRLAQVLQFAIGGIPIQEPFGTLSIGPAYWLGLHLGRWIIEVARKHSKLVTNWQPDDEDSQAQWLIFQVKRWASVVILWCLTCQVIYFQQVVGIRNTCIDYHGKDGSAVLNTFAGLFWNATRWLLLAVGYVFLFCSVLMAAWGSHWKTVGKSVVGGYFLHIFMPQSWAGFGGCYGPWCRAPPNCTNCYGNILLWLKTIAMGNEFWEFVAGVAQILFLFVMGLVYMLIAGPFFMMGFVPITRGLSKIASQLPKNVPYLCIVVFVVADGALNLSSEYEHPVVFSNLLSWFIENLPFVPPALASAVAVAVVVMVPMGAALLVASISMHTSSARTYANVETTSTTAADQKNDAEQPPVQQTNSSGTNGSHTSASPLLEMETYSWQAGQRPLRVVD